jgi:hypothetical protein
MYLFKIPPLFLMAIYISRVRGGYFFDAPTSAATSLCAVLAVMPPSKRAKKSHKSSHHQALRSPSSLMNLQLIPLELFEMIVKEVNIFDLFNFLCTSKTVKVQSLSIILIISIVGRV